LFRIAAQIREWQDRDGRLLRQCRGRLGAGGSRGIGNIGGNGRSDIAIAATRRCFDPVLAIRCVGQHPAQSCDLNRHIIIGNRQSAPAGLDQRVLGHRYTRVFEQPAQQRDSTLPEHGSAPRYKMPASESRRNGPNW
jgi:hypothetical protein